ncbi:hypothetical protein [Amycolatopsis sp. NPDC059657]|uniref:hypothetical protein n=1 Tax=Amycolatopsis sp. NPDC059657 TaxID=3346899 RepID=UPI00366F3C6B
MALADWYTLTALADALVARSSNKYRGWGDVVMFAACTAARIGEVSGCRVKDIDTSSWSWQIRRQTTTAPGGLVDKGAKGNRARKVPLIEDIRELVECRIVMADRDPEDRRPRLARGNTAAPASGSPVRCGCGGLAEQAPARATIRSSPRRLIATSKTWERSALNQDGAFFFA